MIESSKTDLLNSPGSREEDHSPANVEAILRTILGRRSEHFGLAAAVLRGQRIIAQGAAGVRKRGAPQRITLEDKFLLGSSTKAMTATLVAMLVEEGKLSWTTTLGEVFADTVKPMHPTWQNVTLRQVLAHRAGLPFETDGPGRVFDLFRAPYASLNSVAELMRPPRARLGTVPQQRLEIARLALSRPPVIPPDTKYWYSNEGYVIAGAVLEHLTGRAWEELLSERLFQPLGIRTGGFGQPGTPGKVDQPWGHSAFVGKPIDPGSPAAQFPFYYGPAGLAHMSITDWSKFIALHLRGDPVNPRRQAELLKLDSFAEMHAIAPITPYSKGWAMRGITWLATGESGTAVTYRAGWFISTSSWAKGTQPGHTGRRFWHGGSNGISHTVTCIAPEIDFAVLVACNRGLDIAVWKTRQALRALIRTFAPGRTA
jgi:CubicO group peptidase (beta-lactamase class C family)